MATDGSIGGSSGLPGDDDQRIIDFRLSGAILHLEIEDAPPKSVDLSFLIVQPQTLSLTGDDLSISGGNTVSLAGIGGGAGAMDHFDIFGNLIT